MPIEKFLEKINAQKQIDKFEKKYKNKKIILYGAGIFAKTLIDNYNLSNLNIIGITDKKFENNKSETYLNFKTYTPEELKEIDYDILFLSVLNIENILKSFSTSNILKSIKNKNIKIRHFKKTFWNKISEMIPEKSNESCIICGYKKMNTYFATIAPFLVDLMFDFKEKQTELLHCSRCKISYFKLRPNKEQINRYYSGYAQEEHSNLRAKYEPLLYESSFTNSNAEPDFRPKEFDRNISCISKEVQNFTKVLDYGGYGDIFPDSFNHTDKYLYDISSDNVPGMDKFVNDLSKLEKNSFDFIMSTHVLEHMVDPRQGVEDMSVLLKKGGYIYIELPDETGLFNDVSNKNKDVFQMHEHINIFKPETLKYLLEVFGFKVLRCSRKKSDFYKGYTGYIWCLAKKK